MVLIGVILMIVVDFGVWMVGFFYELFLGFFVLFLGVLWFIWLMMRMR